MKLRIGGTVLPGNLVLAPMAGVTDLPFRQLCKEQGCDLLYTEMVSAKAILYRNRGTKALLAVREEERPIAVQLFGSDPQILSEMAAQIEDGPYDFIDLNMGCPVPKVVNNGEGSALMKQPKLVEAILGTMVKRLKKPVMIKIRKGFDDNCINAPEIAKIAESCGVAAVAVHGRTRQQFYSGAADWDIIRQVKEAVAIPVIGNGDVSVPEDVKRIVEQTGCDGVMVGRAARGNPWFFSRAKAYLETGVLPEAPDLGAICRMVQRHAAMQAELKGEWLGMKEMRGHIAWYTSGLPHSAAVRRACNEVETLTGLNELLGRLRFNS